MDRYQAVVVVVTFEPPAAVERFRRSEGIAYPVLSDPGRRLYQAFGLRRKSLSSLFTRSTLTAYLRGLGSGRWPQLPRGDLSQLGGDVVLDRDGVIVFRHLSQDPADRPPIETILAAVRRTATPDRDAKE